MKQGSLGRRVVWVVLLALLGGVVLVVGALGTLELALRTRPGQRFILRAVEPEMEKRWSGDAHIEELRGDVLSEFELHGIELRDAEGRTALRIGRLTVSWSPLGLLRRRVEIERVRVDGAEMALRRLAGGRWNLEDLWRGRARQADEPSKWSVKVRRFEVKGSIHALLPSEEGVREVAEALSLEGGGSYVAGRWQGSASLSLDGNALTLRAQARAVSSLVEGDLHLRGDLSSLGGDFQGRIEAEASARRRGQKSELAIEVDGSRLAGPRLRVAAAHLSARWHEEGRAQGSLSARGAVLRGRNWGDVRVFLDGDLAHVRLSVATRAADLQTDLLLAADLRGRPARWSAVDGRVHRLMVAGAGIRLALTGVAGFRLDRRGLEVDRLELAGQGGRWLVDGWLWRRGRLEIHLSAQQVRLDSLWHLIRPSARQLPQLTLDAEVEAHGALSQPAIEGEVLLRMAPYAQLRGRAATARARLQWKHGRLVVEAHGTTTAGEELDVLANAPLPFDETRPLMLRLRLDGLADWLTLFGEQKPLRGRMMADVDVGGSARAPVASLSLSLLGVAAGQGRALDLIGSAAYAGGRGLVEGRVVLDRHEAIRLRAEVEEVEIPGGRGMAWRDVVKLDGRLRGELLLDGLSLGRLQGALPAVGAAGTLAARLKIGGRLQAPQVEGDLEVKRFALARLVPSLARLGPNVDGTIHVVGGRDASGLSLHLTVARGVIRLPRLAVGKRVQSTSPLEDVVYVDEAAPTRPSTALKLGWTLKLDLSGPLTIEGPELSTDVRGQLQVVSRGGRVRLGGQAETSTGWVEIVGRRFVLEHARAAFDLAGPPDPAIDVRLQRRVSEVLLFVNVTGTASQPKVSLGSEPPVYGEAQLVGLLLSDDPNAPASPGSLDQKAIGLLAGVLVSKLKQQLVPGLPVDVLKLDVANQGSFGQARIEVGKFITPRLYLSYSHQFGGPISFQPRNANQATIEWRFARRLHLGTTYGDAGVGAVDIYYTTRF